MEDNNSFLLLLSAHQNDETFSPVIFNILKEPMLIHKETLPHEKALDLSFITAVTHILAVNSIFQINY